MYIFTYVYNEDVKVCVSLHIKKRRFKEKLTIWYIRAWIKYNIDLISFGTSFHTKSWEFHNLKRLKTVYM